MDYRSRLKTKQTLFSYSKLLEFLSLGWLFLFVCVEGAGPLNPDNLLDEIQHNQPSVQPTLSTWDMTRNFVVL